MSEQKRILLGVTGGIAAYKACDVASALIKDGFAVDVVMTRNAQEFVQPLTFQTLVKAPIYVDTFAPIEDFSVEHISLAQRASLALVCPATANIIGKLANGIADDLLTTTLMAAWKKPLVVCPAMNTAMYENPALQKNLKVLQERGAHIVSPESGRLACGDEGQGRLAAVETILETVKELA